MGKTGKAPEEEKPDFGKGNEGELGSTRSQRERAPKKIFSPTDPPVAAARAKKTSSESSPVSSKSSFAKKQNVAKTSRSSSITFGGEEPKSEESSTSASTAPQTTEAKPEVQSKSVNERPIKEEIISDDDDAHAYPSLAERVKRNRESILPKPVVTSPVAAKKRPLTHSSKSDKKLVAPQQHKAKVGPQKVSSLLMSSEKTKKMPSQPNRLPNTGVPQKPGKKETAGNSLEKNKDIEHTDKSKDYEVIQASKVRRSSSLEDKSSKTVKSAKITVPKEVSAKDTVQSSTLQEFAKTKMVGSSTKTGTKLIVTGVARATPVTPKTDVTAKPKEVPKACVSSFPKDQQEAGPSRAYDAPNPVPLVRTTILPQLTEEGKRLRAETQRIQEAGATEMEDRPPILPKVTEEFKKRLYDPYVRSRMREEGSGSEQSSADIETPPPLQQNLDEEHESVEEPQEFPSLVVPSPQQNLNEEHKLAEEPPEIPDVRIPLVVVPSVPRQGSSSKESEGEQSSKQIYNPSLSSSLQLSKPTNRMKGKNAPVRKSSADVTTAELQKNVREEEESNSSKEVESGKDIDPLPEPGKIFRNRAKTTSGPTVPSKNVPTTMSSDFKTSSLDSIPERQRKDNNSESQGADVQSEKPEKAAAAKAATASDIPMEPRLTRRTAIASLKQNESVMPANLEGLRDDASTPFDAEKLPEESEEFLHDSSSDKKKKKKKKKRHSEKHDSEEPPHDNDVQDPSAPETPKGSLKFKISLKGSPTIKASTPCEEMKEQEDELIDVESDVDKKKIQSKSVPPKKVCLQLVSGASKPVANKPKVVPAKVIVNDAPSSSGLPTPSNPTENVFSSIFEKSIKEEAMDYEYIDEKVATSIPDKAVACSKTVESKDSDDVSARTRSSRNAAKILPKKIPELDRDKSTPGSTSPELGDAGLGYSYPRPAAPKNKETVQKLGKKDKPEEEDESEIVPTRTLRPRKPAISAPKKQMIKKPEIEGLQLPYYTGPVKDLKPIWKHEPTLAEERESRTEAMTQAIRNALLSEPMKYVPDELVSEDELYHDNPASLYYYINDSYKWERPALENGKDYDPDDFEDVAAEMPQLRDQKLACLDPDREESFWEIPENREEYYDSNEEKIDRFLKQCQILGIQIDRGLRHLHSHCGHNPQQALETIDRRAKSMVLYKPLTEREQQIFQEVYRAYGKNFRKIAYFCNLPVKKVVQHYYKSKKTYCYKKLMLQNPCRVNGRISEGKFPGTCFFCKRKARTLKADRRFEGDEHPRLICMTCRTNRKTVNGHLEKWSQIFQGDRIQELDLPILSERLTEKDRYREERGFCIAQMYLANSGEESAFDIQYPTDFNFLFHDELKPTFEDFAKIAAREQQRLKNLGLKVSKNDEQFDPKEDFCMNLKEFYKDPTPQPSVQEQLPEMREKLKLTINKCKTIWNEILELEGDSSEEDERDDKMDDIVSQFRKMKKPSKVATTELFTETDYRYTMQAFVRYGVDFPSAALIVKNKTPAAIEEFYKENKANFDKFLEPYHGQRAIEEYKEKMKREDPKQAEYYDKCEFKITDPDPTEPSATKL